jgi:hypothetical protein
MPPVDNKLPVRFGKLVRPRQFAHFQAERFAKFDAITCYRQLLLLLLQVS